MTATELRWIPADQLPDVLPGHMRRFLVTIESEPNRSRRVEMAHYANNHWLECDASYAGDDIDDDGGKRWTGWMQDAFDACGDMLSMKVNGNVVAWAEVPNPAE
jgi:hypothetical protein